MHDTSLRHCASGRHCVRACTAAHPSQSVPECSVTTGSAGHSITVLPEIGHVTM